MAEISAEELANWLTPRQALGAINEAFDDIGIVSRLIMGRLKGGLIKAGAMSSSWSDTGTPTAPVLIGAHLWGHLSERTADWWDTGDVRFFLPAGNHRAKSAEARYFGIRFEPSGVHAAIADRRKPLRPSLPKAVAEVAPTTMPPQNQVEASVSKPKVSAQHLDAWWTFYKAIRPVSERTEDNAMAHFEQCMPDKAVTRARIRALRGAQKSGPKPKTAE